MLTRADLLTLIEAAFAAKQYTYARQAAQKYLAEWPGDLEFQFILARAYAAEGSANFAAGVLETLVAADPEDFKAHRLLGAQLLALGKADFSAHAFACAHVGDGLGTLKNLALPGWAASARASYLAEKIGDWQTAQREAESAVRADTLSPLPALAYLAPLWHSGQLELALPLAEGFHARWPKAVVFKLALAECLFTQGAPASLRATELLHEAATQDCTGQVAVRHWGVNHPYRALWETNFAAPAPGPLPAELMRALGLNQLRSPKSQVAGGKWQVADGKSQVANGKSVGNNVQLPIIEDPRSKTEGANNQLPVSEEVSEIQAQLDSLAHKLASKETLKYRLKNMLQREGRLYVILSSRSRLTQAFGAEGFGRIDAALKALALNASLNTGMKSAVLYVDEAQTLTPFGLQPVDPAKAWDIKLLIGQLAAQLKAKEQSLGALLIVGGAHIIPFHHLPNPTDDPDPDIPSDNPYAAADENYFVPEWPMGRLPCGAERDPAQLIHAIEIAANAHRVEMTARASHSWLRQMWEWLQRWAMMKSARTSLGYAADVWKEASLAVFAQIGRPRDLLTCPPADASWFPIKQLAPSHISYFNLHGIEDGPDWYGQRGYDSTDDAPEYPVALRPADVVNSGRAPVIVFSEACYGANIFNKRVGEALCLRFLECGSRAVIGSTKIAYGSVTTPLIGADLLGRLFWQNANAGLPVGEALRRAKLQMAQAMHERQGFLDGEDQKTLISFVLYGDPLAAAPDAPGKKSKQSPPVTSVRPKDLPPTADDKAEGKIEIPPDTVAQIKGIVAQYLPGMREAELCGAYVQARCLNPHRSAKNLTAKNTPRTTVVTLAKTFNANAHAHPHFARVTVDEKGSVVKLAVSR
jgi:hypothetical protein